MAWMISLLVRTSVLMSRSVTASWMFGTTVGGGLFKSSLKYSVQRRCCSPSDVNKIPFLSFTSKHVGYMAFTCYDLGDLIYCSLLIACSFLLRLGCKVLYVLPFICSCSVFHLFVRCPIHLLMSFFKPLGYRVHNFLL